jgi:hypothetical protein
MSKAETVMKELEDMVRKDREIFAQCFYLSQEERLRTREEIAELGVEVTPADLDSVIEIVETIYYSLE